jgi:hypothetical protein
MVGRNDIVFSGYKSQKTTEQEGTEKNRAKKEEKNKPKKRKERRSRRARTRVLCFISVPRVQENKIIKELPGLMSSVVRLQLHHTKSVGAKEAKPEEHKGSLKRLLC